ncbi:hypothetical protein L1987_67197 [Smallanthus sonchifolius]|uniref:Uncharacterized protein n=1 Tax=Smallanthus sonchifolius TaxID=185202 RepID=A0ACB9BZK3_9ASTR|nr:hypothetical protein L1987_67197 [Smallanthus sonchifolius]
MCRKLIGDLIYLDEVTLEGSKYCITGTTTTFYVNSSFGNTFDPKPTKADSEATTLIGLLQKISSKFRKLSVKCWNARLLLIRLKTSSNDCLQIRGLDCILFLVNAIQLKENVEENASTTERVFQDCNRSTSSYAIKSC